MLSILRSHIPMPRITKHYISKNCLPILPTSWWKKHGSFRDNSCFVPSVSHTVKYPCWVYTYSLMMTHFWVVGTYQNTKIKCKQSKPLPCRGRTVRIQLILQCSDECSPGSLKHSASWRPNITDKPCTVNWTEKKWLTLKSIAANSLASLLSS